MRDDDPEDTLGDVFLSAMFGEHPVGRPVIGSVESISTMTRAQLHSFHVRRYTPERMVVAVAGNVDHDEVVRLCTSTSVRGCAGPHPWRPARAPVGCRAGRRLQLGQPRRRADARVPRRADARRHWNHRWALSVLNSALGGGLSSRLFQQIRETRGLAYSVYSSIDTFSDTRCAVDVRRVSAGAVRRGHAGDDGRAGRRSRATESPQSECRIAKGSLRGGLVLGPGGLGIADEPHRPQRAELRHAPQHRPHARTGSRPSPSTRSMPLRAYCSPGPFGAAVLGPVSWRRSRCRSRCR